MLNADELSPKLLDLRRDRKSDDDHWSLIEAMHPVPHSAKVADFLLRSSDDHHDNECDNEAEVCGRHTATSGLLAADACENDAASENDNQHSKKCYTTKVRWNRSADTSSKMTTV